MAIWHLACHYISAQWKWNVLWVWSNCKVLFLDGVFKSCLEDWMDQWNSMYSIQIKLKWFIKWGVCHMTYRVFDVMNDQNFINLYVYEMFSPSHLGRADLGCEPTWASSLVSNDLRSKGLRKAGLSFCKLINETWFKFIVSILTEFIPMWRVAKWLLNWNMIIKKFLSWKSAFSSFDRQWTVLFIWRMSFCYVLKRRLLVSVSSHQIYKVKCFLYLTVKVILIFL